MNVIFIIFWNKSYQVKILHFHHDYKSFTYLKIYIMNRKKKNHQLLPKTIKKNSPSGKKNRFHKVIKNVCVNTISDISSPPDINSPPGISSRSSTISETHSIDSRTLVVSPHSSMVSEASIDSKVSDSELLVVSSDTDENDTLKAALPADLSENNLSVFVKNEEFDLINENLDFSESDLNFDGIASLSESEISVDQIVINKESDIFLPKDSPSFNSETERITLNLSNCMKSSICLDRNDFINKLNLMPVLNSGLNSTNCMHCFGFGVGSSSFRDAFEFHSLKNSISPAVVNKNTLHFNRSLSQTKKSVKINIISSPSQEQENQNIELLQSSCDQAANDSAEYLQTLIIKQKRTPMVVLERLHFPNIDINECISKSIKDASSIVEVINDVPDCSPRRTKTKENALDNMTSEHIIKITPSISEQKPKNLKNEISIKANSNQIVFGQLVPENISTESAKLPSMSPENTIAQLVPETLLTESIKLPSQSPKNTIVQLVPETPLTESVKLPCKSPKSTIGQQLPKIPSTKAAKLLSKSLKNSEKNESPGNPPDKMNTSLPIANLKDSSQNCNNLNVVFNSQSSLQKENSNVSIKNVQECKIPQKKKLIEKIILKKSQSPLNTIWEKKTSSPKNNSVDLTEISKNIASDLTQWDDGIAASSDSSAKNVLNKSVSSKLAENLTDDLSDTSVQQNKVITKASKESEGLIPLRSSTDLSQNNSVIKVNNSLLPVIGKTRAITGLKMKKKIIKQKSLKSEQKVNKFHNFSITIQTDSQTRKVDSTLQLLDYDKNINHNIENNSQEINNNVLSDVLSSEVDRKLKKGASEKMNGQIAECSLQKQKKIELSAPEVSSPERRFSSSSVEDPHLVNSETLQDNAAEEILELHLQAGDEALEDFAMEDCQRPRSSSQSVTSDSHSGNDYTSFIQPPEGDAEPWTYRRNSADQSNSAESYKRDTSEDSESDSDRDYKRFRRDSPSEKKSISMDDNYLPDKKDLEKRLRDLCRKGALHDAVAVASHYLPISLDEAKEDIVLKLFSCIVDYFNMNNLTSLDKWPIMESIMDLIKKYDLYTTVICSTVMGYCHSETEMCIYTEKIFDDCCQKNVPLNAEAIIAFGNYLSTKLSVPEQFAKFLNFLQYIKNVCKKSIPPKFLHIILKWSMTSEDIYDYFDQICSFLPGINDHEIDAVLLQEFLKFCIKNEWWQYVAKCFLHWVKGPKKILLSSLFQALAEQYMCSENLFKFATAVHGTSGQLPLNHLNVYGQILTIFMLEAYDQQNFDLAFSILLILHKQNIDYNELQLSVASHYASENSYMRKSTTEDHFLFPQTVSLAAVDICLQVKRPKDAYELFKAYSWINVKDVEIPQLQSELLEKKFKCLIKLVRVLLNVHLLKGFDAFINLFENIVSDNFEILNAQKGELDNLFNEYLTNLLNNDEGDNALRLYESGSEHCKGLLNVECDILRGLLVILAKNGKMEKAKNFFNIGQIKNVYCIEKPQPPWVLTILSFWTRYEIKFAVELYLQNLFPLLKSKPQQAVFEDWFQVQIVIKEEEDTESEINCLRETSNRVISAMERISLTLRTIDPNLKVEEIPLKNMLLILPETVYNLWRSKYSSMSPMRMVAESFPINGQKGISFGKERTPRSSIDSSSSEKFRRLSSPLISPRENASQRGEFAKNIELSPQKHEMLHKSVFIKITPPHPSLNKNKPVQNTFDVGRQNIILDSSNVSKVPIKDETNFAVNSVEHARFKPELEHGGEMCSKCKICVDEAKCSPVKGASDCQSSNSNFSDKILCNTLSNDNSESRNPPKPKRKIVRPNTGVKFINSRPNSPTRLKKIAPSPIMKRAKESLDRAKIFKIPAARTISNKFENYTISVTGSACRNVVPNNETNSQRNKVQKRIVPLWHKPIQKIAAPVTQYTEEMHSSSSSVSPLPTEEINQEFAKIRNFLKTKFLQRHGNLPLEEIDQRTKVLALKFISDFEIETKLDRTTMKYLIQFAEENI